MSEYEILSKSTHKNIRFKQPSNYIFTKDESFLPIGLSEVQYFSKTLPVVFIKNTDETFFVAVLLSIYANKNEFVDNNGKWTLPYLPSFLTLYPFRVLKVKATEGDLEPTKALGFKKNEKNITFVTDESFQPVFNEDGTFSEVGDKIRTGLVALEREKVQANYLIKKFENLKILTEITLENSLGERTLLPNIFAVNDEKLKALSAKDIKELSKDFSLDLIFRQKFSSANFQNLLKKSDSTSISTREKVILRNKAQKDAEINSLVKNLLIEE